MTRAPMPELSAPDPVLEQQIRARLDEVEQALDKAARSDSDFVSETAAYLLRAGGKRFRPLMVLLSGCFGDGSDPRLIQGSVAIELTHVATLYHDDVIDEAERRHGIPAVNARWGNTVAILTGDFLFAKASEISSDLGAEVTRLLARTIAILCDGQIREVQISGRLDQSEQTYMDIIRRKTAALIATSCRLGGMLSEAPVDLVDTLDDFGLALGMGFQLSDDIMDVISTEEELKKAPGQDMREGVYTLPVLHALTEGPHREELRTLLADGAPMGDKVTRALEIVRDEGSLAPARAAVSQEVRRAQRLGAELPPSPARDALLHIAEFIAVRCGADA